MLYTRKYFIRRSEVTRASAERILGHIFQHSVPSSVLDVGCATGIWLRVAKEKGVGELLGLDGPWVDRETVEIGEGLFREADLEGEMPTDLEVHDLVLCIEVAEHLSPGRAKELVQFLCQKGRAVLFSAAVPGQGGTGHVNEQKQSYWCAMFEQEGFKAYDVVRPFIWDDHVVNVIYKQNMLLFVSETATKWVWVGYEHCRLESSNGFEVDRIHPDLFLARSQAQKIGVLSRIKKQITDKVSFR